MLRQGNRSFLQPLIRELSTAAPSLAPHAALPSRLRASLASSLRGPNASSRQWSSCGSSSQTIKQTATSRSGRGPLFASGVGGVALLLVTLVWQAQHPISLDATASSSSTLPTELYGSFCTDSATGTPVPLILSPPPVALASTPTGKLRLVGLGVRTVSFLRVRVYVAALFVDEAAWSEKGALHKDGDLWRNFEQGRLLDKSKGKARGGVEGEEFMRMLMDAGVPCVIRIIPVRSTDFAHLRDGFTRAVQARLKVLRKLSPQLLTAEVDEHLSASIQHLKSIFPKASLPKGAALDLVFAPAEPATSVRAGRGSAAQQGARMALTLEYGGKLLGRVDPPPSDVTAGKQNMLSVASELFLAYFADKDAISAPFKQSVAEGLKSILSGEEHVQ
ncbi:hypothetical protein K437DRAFT_142541 [Tilletiaria anomala UBC 951]|uniref:Chalcone isomerase domain-containing protein n=1 Tax=Tilletiaria anomala (strain ATCC 24038 / CBS 436.72 / UBC 951) TaxID=1037660 RepID=A0A066VZV4_TILAU|nr:uncharacterized protein K437DRAFT_142541 [Tilletiaria anomala UBC 951]KDN44075.1 hypothetical protein K437DRAFT_142541 [Tilletiaria anomala UBC 951]